jgi:hypothetical protein
MPIVLLNDDLYELHNLEEANLALKKVESSRLLFNYSYKGKKTCVVVFFVTKAGLTDFLQMQKEGDNFVEDLMIKAIDNKPT